MFVDFMKEDKELEVQTGAFVHVIFRDSISLSTPRWPLTHSDAQTGIELETVLAQTPKYWDHSCEPPSSAVHFP